MSGMGGDAILQPQLQILPLIKIFTASCLGSTPAACRLVAQEHKHQEPRQDSIRAQQKKGTQHSIQEQHKTRAETSTTA